MPMTDKLSTEAIRACIRSALEKYPTGRGIEAESELAAILKRIEDRETQLAVMRGLARTCLVELNDALYELRVSPCQSNATARASMNIQDCVKRLESALTPDTGKVVEKLPSLARVQEILKDVDGVHSSSQAFPADAIRRIGSLWGYAHELAEMVCALPVTWGQEEVTPDTGKRVVDVETKETIWKSK